MSRYDTFIYHMTKREEYGVKGVAQACKEDIFELAKLAETSAEFQRRGAIVALRFVYELAALLMTDRRARQAFTMRKLEVKEWRTSSKLLNFLARNLLGVSRQQASKCSGVMSYAFDRHVSAEEFDKFVRKNGGIEGTYLRSIQSRRSRVRNEDCDNMESKDEVAPTPAPHRSQPREASALVQARSKTEASYAENIDQAAALSGQESGCRQTDATDYISIQNEHWVQELQRLLLSAAAEAETCGHVVTRNLTLSITPERQITITEISFGPIG